MSSWINKSRLCLVWYLMTIAPVMANDTIQIVTEDWYPYNFTNDKGEIDGLSTAVVKGVMKAAGLSYKIEMMSWNKAYDKAKTQKNVLVYTMYRTKEREPHFKWICPLIKTKGLHLYKLSKRRDVAIKNLDDVRNYLIGIVDGDVSYEYLTNRGFKLGKQLYVATDEDANTRMLLNGRVDLTAQEEAALKERLKKQGAKFSDVTEVLTLMPAAKQNKCMAFGLNTSDALVAKVAKAFDKVRQRNAKK